MNKEKSGGDSGIYPVDAYKEHMAYTGVYHNLREGFFVGGRQLGGSHRMHIQGADTHSPVYSTDYMQSEHDREAERFNKHQKRMAAIIAEQEEDLLILLIL